MMITATSDPESTQAENTVGGTGMAPALAHDQKTDTTDVAPTMPRPSRAKPARLSRPSSPAAWLAAVGSGASVREGVDSSAMRQAHERKGRQPTNRAAATRGSTKIRA